MDTQIKRRELVTLLKMATHPSGRTFESPASSAPLTCALPQTSPRGQQILDLLLYRSLCPGKVLASLALGVLACTRARSTKLPPPASRIPNAVISPRLGGFQRIWLSSSRTVQRCPAGKVSLCPMVHTYM